MATSTFNQLQLIAKVRLDTECPLLRRALVDWAELLADSNVDLRAAFGVGSGGAIMQLYPTLRAWIDGGIASAASIDAACAQMGLSAWLHNGRTAPQWIDRFVVPELLIGLSQFPLVPRHSAARFTRALAALTAVEAHRGLIDAQVQPDELADGGCWLRPLLANDLIAGRFLADRVGEEAAIAAAAGQAPIEDALDSADLAEFAALIAGHHDPRAIELGQSGGLTEVLAVWAEDAVLSLVQQRSRRAGVAVALEIVPVGGLVVDVGRAELRRAGAPRSITESAAVGAIDPEIYSVALPIAPCKLAASRGWAVANLAIEHLDGCDDLVAALLDSLDAPPIGTGPTHSVAGDGFELTWHRALRQ
ncbi:MAG: hypothetical protein EXR77_12090 [Myxococcales bacterium]|nr:hypothetical protein [Myxococcales bacterium]